MKTVLYPAYQTYNSNFTHAFYDILAKRITDKVSVFDDRIVFRFKSGTEIENDFNI